MPSDKEKLICSKCRYETDYLGTYRKPPVCPTCKNLLSFKDSTEVNLDEMDSVPAASRLLKILAVLFLAVSIGLVLRHFHTFDSRGLLSPQVQAGETFFGGASRSKIGVDWIRIPYSYAAYFQHQFKSRYFMMIKEDHRYVYKGGRGGQVEIEYFYSNSKGKKGSHLLQLAGPSTYLDIPAIPYVKGSRTQRLKLAQDPSGRRLRVSEV